MTDCDPRLARGAEGVVPDQTPRGRRRPVGSRQHGGILRARAVTEERLPVKEPGFNERRGALGVDAPSKLALPYDATRQPMAERADWTLLSLATFASNLADQNASRVAGVVAYRHPGCRFQKHP